MFESNVETPLDQNSYLKKDNYFSKITYSDCNLNIASKEIRIHYAVDRKI